MELLMAVSKSDLSFDGSVIPGSAFDIQLAADVPDFVHPPFCFF
jgi:hypothetical protein